MPTADAMLSPVTGLAPSRGLTPRELGKLLRVSAAKIRAWIQAGELKAVNVAAVRCGRARLVILPHHLAEWERARSAAKPKPAPRRRKQTMLVDYFPD